MSAEKSRVRGGKGRMKEKQNFFPRNFPISAEQTQTKITERKEEDENLSASAYALNKNTHAICSALYVYLLHSPCIDA